MRTTNPSRSRTWARRLTPIAVLTLAAPLLAQGPPPPLGPPPVPPANPITASKALLGKALFWDEQLSSTGTVACGTCHIPSAGGSDPRSSRLDPASRHPGLDGLFATPDDVVGSPGVIQNGSTTDYLRDPTFGLAPRVTGRKAPSMINAAYAPILFWDGRAANTFVDPQGGGVVIQLGGALESQSVAPPLSDVEMGHVGGDWDGLLARLASVTPLALSPQPTPDLAAFVAGRSYPELFQQAFGTPQLTSARFALAVATYERTLFSNQTPIDQVFGGNPQALTPLENQGFQIFNGPQANCRVCHAGNLFTNNAFEYIGVRPQGEDLGRFEVTGNPGDRGRMRVPGLRNVELRGPYFHNGAFQSLEEVVDFYDRGGDFDAPNKHPLIRPLGLTPQQRSALLAFLRRPLTDPRVAAETPPFDRPALYAGSARQPVLYGHGTPGTDGHVPRVVVVEPPHVGNPSFTVGIDGGLGGAPAILALDLAPAPFGSTFQGATSHLALGTGLVLVRAGRLRETRPGAGWISISLALPDDPGLVGTALHGQWFVLDSGGGGRFAASEAFRLTYF